MIPERELVAGAAAGNPFAFPLYEIRKLLEKIDPERDLVPATKYDVGRLLSVLEGIAITLELMWIRLERVEDTAGDTARRQSAALNGMDPDV
jgi:hypothetical protein